MGFLEDMARAFDPKQNGVAQAFQPVTKTFDPHQNGLDKIITPTHIIEALDPEKNGFNLSKCNNYISIKHTLVNFLPFAIVDPL